MDYLRLKPEAIDKKPEDSQDETRRMSEKSLTATNSIAECERAKLPDETPTAVSDSLWTTTRCRSLSPRY